ncbi:MAG: hypothetical protein V3T70_06200, partial [Phycisphaerae bacterium]
RIGIRRDLTNLVNADSGGADRLFTREDIRKVFQRGHVRLTRDGVEFLFKLANTPAKGGLRKCRDLVQLVIDLYPNEQVSAERLWSAYALTGEPKESEFNIDRVAAVESDEREAVAATA